MIAAATVDIKNVNPTPPAGPPRKVERQDRSRRDEGPKRRKKDEHDDPEDDKRSIDTYA